MKKWLQEEDYLLIVFAVAVLLFGTIYFLNPPKKNIVGQTVEGDFTPRKLLVNEVSIYPTEALELFNNTENDINLDGYTISDRMDRKYTIKNKSINANGYLVFKTDELGFNINNTSELIRIRDRSGNLIDTFVISKLVGDISTGITDGKKVYYKTITLGSKNDNTTYKGFSSVVEFSKDGGYATVGEKIELSTDDDSKIYYTTDGTFPTLNSNVYTSPITINENTVIKAFSYKEGYLESDITSRTFFVGRHHNLPIVSVSTENMEFYNQKKVETKANFEFYESDGTFGIGLLGDVKTSGNGSWGLPQKTMSFYLRKKYSANKVTYPFFPNMNYYTYSSLLLRGSGTDSHRLHITEGLLTSIIKNEMDIDMRVYRPVVVYLNGEYYGIYSLTEKLNSDYVESKFNVDKKKVDFIKYTGREYIMRGTKDNFSNLVNYINTHDVTDASVYSYLKSQIDIGELINYWIVEAFYSNIDYPHNNVKFYKSNVGKWRWILYDLDYAILNEVRNDFLFLNINNDVEWVQIVKALSNNSEFRDLYYTSLGKYLKTTFKPDRVNKIIDNITNEIRDEMSYHLNRWPAGNLDPSSVQEWESNINTFKQRYNNHYASVVEGLKNGFNLSDSDYDKYFGGLI